LLQILILKKKIMQKNWYIIYTKAKCEKKVSASLTKKKIENYCPLNGKPVKSSWRYKMHQEPLFTCYVFACIFDTETDQLKEVDGVISLVYWKGRPAVVQEEEITTMKLFTHDYQVIRLEKAPINLGGPVKLVDGPAYSIEGKVLTVKNKTVKVNLPSIGYTMVAELETNEIMGRKVIFGNKELLLQ
jgi:transcription antitermination factor NusG